MNKLMTCLCIFWLLALKGYGQSQTEQVFTERSIAQAVFNFTPVQRVGVTDQRFRYAQQILNDTRSAAKQSPDNLNAADYWNITSAFVVLKEPKQNIEAAFLKAIHTDGPTICAYIKLMGPGRLDKLIPESFLPFYANCAQMPDTDNSSLNVDKYAETNKLNADLVRALQVIYLRDTKFRMSSPVDWTRQRPLDEMNQRSIDSLFKLHQIYIGRSLAGKQLESVMWLVVQHAPLGMMEKYLPFIATAVAQKQLDAVPLKMLLDRIYWLKYQTQIFGSQGPQIKLADENIRDGVIKQYRLN